MRALVNCGAGALARYSLVLLREFRVHAVRYRARRESLRHVSLLLAEDVGDGAAAAAGPPDAADASRVDEEDEAAERVFTELGGVAGAGRSWDGRPGPE